MKNKSKKLIASALILTITIGAAQAVTPATVNGVVPTGVLSGINTVTGFLSGNLGSSTSPNVITNSRNSTDFGVINGAMSPSVITSGTNGSNSSGGSASSEDCIRLQQRIAQTASKRAGEIIPTDSATSATDSKGFMSLLLQPTSTDVLADAVVAKLTGYAVELTTKRASDYLNKQLGEFQQTMGNAFNGVSSTAGNAVNTFANNTMGSTLNTVNGALTDTSNQLKQQTPVSTQPPPVN